MKPRIHIFLILMIFIASAFSLLIGPAKFSLSQTLSALLGGQGETLSLIIWEIRLPRLLLSLLIGFSLGISGAAMQGFLRNPLAEPGVLGISSASALGAVIALQMGFAFEGAGLMDAMENYSIAPLFALPLSAMLGAFLAAILLFLFARDGVATKLILVGIGISAIGGAKTALVLNLSPNPFAALEIMFWMMGSVADRAFYHVWMVLPFVLLGTILIMRVRRGLDALSLGEDTAQSLGMSLRSLTIQIVMGVAMMVGAGVAVAGAIGFVGLVVPHMLRPFVGAKPSSLLIISGLGGAALLTIADVLTRVIAPERDLKLGVITALIGAPVFLHLVMRGQAGRGR